MHIKQGVFSSLQDCNEKQADPSSNLKIMQQSYGYFETYTTKIPKKRKETIEPDLNKCHTQGQEVPKDIEARNAPVAVPLCNMRHR